MTKRKDPSKPPRKTYNTDAERVLLNVKIVEATGCWEWTGYRLKGYGQLRVRRRPVLAHRLSWEIANGRPAPDGLHVLHSCDNPPCCNPAHLRLGTDAENIADMDRRGRRAPSRGERNSHARLTADQVREIRALSAAGHAPDDVAGRFGVTGQTIRSIRGRHSWRHVS